MTTTDLREMICSWENLNLAAKYISDYPEYFDALMDLAFDDQLEHSWRASWVADKIHDQHPELIVPYLDAIADFLLKTKDGSKKRQFLKLLSLHPVPETKAGEIFDFCIRHFTQAEEAISVRVYAMQVLYNISETELELKPELIQLIENEIEFHPSAGIRSRGTKLLQKLYKQHRL